MSLKLLPNKTYAKLPFGAKDAAEEEEKAELISGIPWLQPIVDSQTFLYATIGVLFGNMVVMCMPYQGKQQHQQQHTTTAAARQQHSALTAHHSPPLPLPTGMSDEFERSLEVWTFVFTVAFVTELLMKLFANGWDQFWAVRRSSSRQKAAAHTHTSTPSASLSHKPSLFTTQQEGWNVFDTCIVTVSVFDTAATMFGRGPSGDDSVNLATFAYCVCCVCCA